MKSTEINYCPLCNKTDNKLFGNTENREYLHCKNCDLVYVPSSYLLSKNEEKAKYDNHQNTPENQGYIDFLNRLLEPMQTYIPPQSFGLDFGSGPGPTLSKMFEEKGHKMDIYDYFYADNPNIFDKTYDFITTTEVIEHLCHPKMELERLWSMLKPGGVLGIMTAFRPDQKIFQTWYYKRDLTHIRFFTPKTFDFLACKLNAKITIPQSGVVILKKN